MVPCGEPPPLDVTCLFMFQWVTHAPRQILKHIAVPFGSAVQVQPSHRPMTGLPWRGRSCPLRDVSGLCKREKVVTLFQKPG